MELFKLLGRIVIENSEANDEIDESTKKASDASGKISGAFKKIGAAVGAYIAVDKIKDFGLGCIQAAADANAAASQFSQVFGELEDSASASLSKIANEAGISENRMRGSFTGIAAFAKTTGMDTESALALSERAMIAVADSAAFYDRTLEDTTESLQSFLKGNFENDAALGLSCTETTRNAAANKLYGKSFKELSEEQKQLTLLQMVEDANKASGAIGQAARESDTWTNQTGNLKQAWTDFQAVLGKPILSTATSAVGWLADKVGKLAQTFSEGKNPVQTFIDKMKSLGGWFSKVGWYAKYVLREPLEKLQGVFNTVKEAVKPFIDRLVEYVTGGEAAEDITSRIYDAISFLADAYRMAVDFVRAFIDGLPAYVTNGQMAEDITNRIKDAIQFLSDKFVAVKNALQPFIDQFSEYVSSGQAAEDITNAVRTACDKLKTAYEKVKGFITDVVNGFKDAVEWGKEHETTLQMIAIAVGTLTAAVTAYNIAAAIKKAGGIAEIAQLGILQVQLWALSAAQAAQTVATTVATAATSAFGAVMAFITSPITLVIAAIGALIAIGVLLYKNWDTIKAKCSELVASAKQKFSDMKSSVTEKFSSIKSSALEKINGLKSGVVNKFNEIKDSISEKINSAKDKVKSAIDKIKGFFDFNWELPKIKLPHFSISGEFSLNPPSIPKFGIEWYKKAYDNAMLLNNPTIFGYSSASGKFLGGGDGNGSEVVAGSNTLMGMIGSAVESKTAEHNSRILALLTAILNAIIGGNEDMLKALLSGQTMVLNEREVARLVRKYA